MFEGDRFWFLLVGGDPVEVVRCDSAVCFHRWSDVVQAWVNDNGLFLEVDGPDSFQSQAPRVSREEALKWLEDNTSFTPALADRVASLDAELSAQARGAGDNRPTVDPQFVAAALADLIRSDGAVRERATRLIASLDKVDAGRGRNPWFSGDRQDVEGAVRRFVHETVDIGADTTTSLRTEQVVRDALALADA